MSNHLSHLIRHSGRSKKGDTAQLAAQLAPLEELNKTVAGDGVTSFHPAIAHQEVGAIVVESDSLSIAKDQRRKNQILGLEPVVIVILCLALAFIAFVAWQISVMPAE